MKASELLKKTKEEHAKKVSLYVCNCLGLVCFDLDISGSVTHLRVQNHIKDLLGKHVTLDQWIWQQIGTSPTKMEEYRQKMYVTRQAWLDDMIQYFEAQGD